MAGNCSHLQNHLCFTVVYNGDFIMIQKLDSLYEKIFFEKIHVIAKLLFYNNLIM